MKNKANIKSERIIFRLSVNERIKLKDSADYQGISISKFLRNSFLCSKKTEHQGHKKKAPNFN